MFKMHTIRSFVLASFFLSSLVFAVPSQSSEEIEEAFLDLQEFQELLGKVDPTSLHSALHDYSPKKFQHGVFEEDRAAVEAMHHDDPPLAASIVSIAKRDNSNTTTVPTTVATPSSSAIDMPMSAVTYAPLRPTTTVLPNNAGQSSSPMFPTPVPQSGPTPPIETSPTSELPPVTTTSTSTAPTSSAPGSSVSIPSGPGPVVTSSTSSSVTSGQIVTTTNAQGITVVSTVDGGVVTLGLNGSSLPAKSGKPSSTTSFSFSNSSGSRSTSLQTTTLPDGSQSTVTAVTVVQPVGGATTATDGSGGTATGTAGGSPALQSGLAPRSRGLGWEAVGVLGGAIGFAILL
ncbi:hypothetical protein MMC09_006276 [Bachmanniomyces sp. S44760]|nr:hypothetical protein [Bachmanniomyces sp. S44760]